MSPEQKILNEVGDYYTKKINEYGISPKGVDWNSEESQQLRFQILMQLIEKDNSRFSLLDYGCGYGALLSFIQNKYPAMEYVGYDISDAMLQEAKNIVWSLPKVTWLNSLGTEKCDYIISSGIFNVKQDQTDQDWNNYIETTLGDINSRSIKGFSFNMLTSYSDAAYKKNHLYYASPEYYFKFCKEDRKSVV